jgi:hypothetical protein
MLFAKRGETIYVGIRRIGNVEINGTVSQNGSGTDDVNEVFFPQEDVMYPRGTVGEGRKGDAACRCRLSRRESR